MLRDITILDNDSLRIINIKEGDNRDITFTDEDKENGYTHFVEIETNIMIENLNLDVREGECGKLMLTEDFHTHFNGDIDKLVHEATGAIWTVPIMDYTLLYNGYEESKYHTYNFTYDKKYDEFGVIQFCTKTQDEAIKMFNEWTEKESDFKKKFPYEQVEDIYCDFDANEYGLLYAKHEY